MKDRIYLDNAATTPLDPEVFEAMIPVMREFYGNPSSSHAHGRKVKAMMEEARSSIAKLLKCSPSEIFFTSGGTEADNLALRSCVKSLGVKHIITSPIEHHAVLHTAEELHHKGLAQMHLVNLDETGHVDLNHLQQLLSECGPNTLVSLMHANNEIGNLLDLEQVGQMAHAAGALFHCDTVQTMGHYPFDLSLGHVDFLAAAAHKFNGPKGVGFIYINKKRRLHPEITGGAQEREIRGGTENVYGIIGLAKALEICYRDMEKKHTHISELRNYMKDLLNASIPGVEFNGDADGKCLYTVLSVSFPASETGNMLLFNLDINGISASSGSACSSGSNVGSHVIQALKRPADRTTIRFSFGKFNTREDVEACVEKLKQWYPAEVPANS
ncbi:MAG: cysteine desulfurase [Bacteroidetes bacterium]|nr:cysteine desulfurase [Bacteroidota bacterium]